MMINAADFAKKIAIQLNKHITSSNLFRVQFSERDWYDHINESIFLDAEEVSIGEAYDVLKWASVYLAEKESNFDKEDCILLYLGWYDGSGNDVIESIPLSHGIVAALGEQAELGADWKTCFLVLWERHDRATRTTEDRFTTAMNARKYKHLLKRARRNLSRVSKMAAKAYGRKSKPVLPEEKTSSE